MLLKRKDSVESFDGGRTRNAMYKVFKGFNYSGIIAPASYNWLYVLWRVVALSYGVIYLPLGFILNYIINFQEFTPGEFLMSIGLSMNTCCFAIKYFTMFMYRNRLDAARNYMDKFDEHCNTAEEQDSIRKIVIWVNKMYTIYLTVYFCYGNSCLVDALFNKRPPFNAYYPFVDWRLNRKQLYLQTLVEYFTVGYAVAASTTTDSYALLYVEPLRGHVNILKSRLRTLTISEGLASNEVYGHDKLVECIKYHKTMLGYIEIISPVISITIFAQFIICGSILGVSAINLMLFTDLSSRIQIVSYLGAVFLQTFPLCYYCTCLIDDCDDLATSIFHSNWMNEEKRYRKSLLQFVQKLQQPMTFTAMDIFSITLDTNIKVAKFAFTIYALAKGMNMEDIFAKSE